MMLAASILPAISDSVFGLSFCHRTVTSLHSRQNRYKRYMPLHRKAG